MEFYSATQKSEILSLAGKWVELEDIILSEISQVQKAKYYMFSLICVIWVQYKYKQYYEYIKIHTEHVSKSDTARGDQGRR
jgi:hypothetical protein